MNDQGGGASDIIVLNNLGGPSHNSAAIEFSSDPNLIPEPALGLPVGALLVAGLYFRRRLIGG
jgi:hypothetical protein